MHMADALISPAVGGTMWVLTTGIAAYSIKKIQDELDEKQVPLMGVMGAFIFAAQMINFSIPGTGSSGHLGGGLLLAIILGPYAGFLTMASVLTIQALIFADGGLLALGCNIFNLGFFTCLIAYPFVYKPIMAKGYSAKRMGGAALLAAILALQLGAFSVVLETFFSGKTDLPFRTFALLMQPIHLGIGMVEGLVTAAVVGYIWKARPEILERAAFGQPLDRTPLKKVAAGLAMLAVLMGGALSWFASDNPDGLEWSIYKTAGVAELTPSPGIQQTLLEIQAKTAFLPDYSFKAAKEAEASVPATEAEPAVDLGQSVSGVVGGTLTLLLVVLTGGIIGLFKRRKKAAADLIRGISQNLLRH